MPFSLAFPQQGNPMNTSSKKVIVVIRLELIFVKIIL